MIYFITNQTSIGEYEDIFLCDLAYMFDYFKDKKVIGVDTETTGFDPHSCDVLLIQFGDFEKQFVIDCTTIDLAIFKDFLEDKSKIFLMHNAKFDLRFLMKKGIVCFENVYDTFLAERVLSCGHDFHRKSLQACVYRYYKIRLSKEERGLIHKLGVYHSAIIKYSAWDVKYLPGIREFQLQKAQQVDVINTIHLENSFVTVLAYVEFSGIKLDQQGWLEKSKKDEEKLAEIAAKLDQMVVDLENPKYLKPPDLFDPNPACAIMWSSSKQVIPLFEDLGLNLVTIDKKKKTEKKSIEANVIESQKDIHPIIPVFMEYQKAAKLVSTYGKDFLRHINPATNRIHTNFTQIINTGRLSSGKDKEEKAKDGDVNMQNIPASPEREYFVTEEGNTFIVADYSGQETMVLCYYAKDEEYTNYVTQPDKDLHAFMASLIFSDEIGHLTDMEIKADHPDLRKKAKPGTFAIPYGGSGYTIAVNVGISPEKGEWVYEKYMEKFSGLKKYFEQVSLKTLKQGYVLINPMTGRKWFLHNYTKYQSLRARLESYSNGKTGNYFEGLSAGYWEVYREEKAQDSTKFKEMKLIQSEYFKHRGAIKRTGLNAPIQGTSADMSKLAGIKMLRWIMENDLFNKVKICVPLHDEYCVEAPINIQNKVAKMVQQSMESAAKVFCPTIDIAATPVISKSWEH